MKGNFDAYVLWPLDKMVQNWIDRSTACNFTVSKIETWIWDISWWSENLEKSWKTIEIEKWYNLKTLRIYRRIFYSILLTHFSANLASIVQHFRQFVQLLISRFESERKKTWWFFSHNVLKDRHAKYLKRLAVFCTTITLFCRHWKKTIYKAQWGQTH